MKEYPFLASVIVPMYNVEAYLEACLDSLVAQTISQTKMEVVLVNDGSPDKSGEIAKRYAEKYDNFFYYEKENGGLSSARNFGIRKARGKYFFFLDSDDKLTPKTIKAVTDFFEKHYDEVDEVAYYEIPYMNGKRLEGHYRFRKYLRKSGIYDLEKYPFIKQTRVNVCVKNMGEENLFFDETPGFIQEDQEYNNRVLMKKMKLGYCKEGCYLYNRNNDGGIVSQKFHAYYLFEKSTAYFEKLFSYFPDRVPLYFQNMLVHDLNWKLNKAMLYPFHYDKEAFDGAILRLQRLLERVDIRVITENPVIDAEHKQYWLKMKPNARVTQYANNREHGLLCEGKFVHRSSEMDLRLIRIQVLENGNLRFRGCLRSVFFDHTDREPEIYCVTNGEVQKAEKMHVYPSKFGWLENVVQTNRFFAFEYEFDPKKVKEFYHEVRFDGYVIPVRYSFASQAVFRYLNRLFSVVRGESLVRFDKKRQCFSLQMITKEEADRIMEKRRDRFFLPAWAKRLRKEAMALRQKEEIWLYGDLYTVRKDNGYYQFLHDFEKKDGVLRYYVTAKKKEEVQDLFTPEQRKFVVTFGSREHKKLYLAASVIFNAFYGRSPISPFANEREEQLFYDMEQFFVVYLQHGVLHASLYVQNSAENARADKVVISSAFEMENYSEKYHYRKEDLIPSGMARYDHIDRNKKPKGRILYAPSWRSYLTQNLGPSKWDVQKNKIVGSEYYKGMKAFLESEELTDLLQKEDLCLEVKLHPIIASATDLFDFQSERIRYAASEVEIEDYDYFITDFSSFVFDYAYLCRPILYFVPDYEQFSSGMGHYRELDLPFEKAFGELAKDPQTALSCLQKMVAQKGKADPVYAKRMTEFYLPMEGGAAEGTYQAVKKAFGRKGN